jgi:hypothetical protein
MVGTGAWHFKWEFLSMGTKNYLVTLTLEFYLLTISLCYDWYMYVLGLWYFTWVSFVTKALCVGAIDLTFWLECLTYSWKFWPWLYLLNGIYTRTSIFHMSDLSLGTNRFDLVMLNFMFDPLAENFDLGCIFWMVHVWGFWYVTWVFHEIVPCHGYR